MSRIIKKIIMLYPLAIILKLCHQVILDIVDFLARGVYPQLSFLYVQYRSKVLRGARVVHWWEHSPPTNVARVRILASMPYMWVEYVAGSLPCSERLFSQYSGFPPLLKNQHFQIPIRSGTHGHVSTSSYELLSAPWVNKLQLQLQER